MSIFKPNINDTIVLNLIHFINMWIQHYTDLLIEAQVFYWIEIQSLSTFVSIFRVDIVAKSIFYIICRNDNLFIADMIHHTV